MLFPCEITTHGNTLHLCQTAQNSFSNNLLHLCIMWSSHWQQQGSFIVLLILCYYTNNMVTIVYRILTNCFVNNKYLLKRQIDMIWWQPITRGAKLSLINNSSQLSNYQKLFLIKQITDISFKVLSMRITGKYINIKKAGLNIVSVDFAFTLSF